MKKILSLILFFSALLSVCVLFTSCGQKLAPNEVIFNGQRISLEMTQAEIEGLIGEGVDRVSEIHFIPYDVVAYSDTFEIAYVEKNETQFAAAFFISDNSVRTNSNIAIGDTLEQAGKKCEDVYEVGGGYMIDFYNGEVVKDYSELKLDTKIFYMDHDKDGMIEAISIITLAYNDFYNKDRD